MLSFLDLSSIICYGYVFHFFQVKKQTNGTKIDKVDSGEGPIGQRQKEETGSHILPTESGTGVKRPRKTKPPKHKKAVQHRLPGPAEGDSWGTYGCCASCFHIQY